jgi:flagellar basal-body rod modification protein FlgD
MNVNSTTGADLFTNTTAAKKTSTTADQKDMFMTLLVAQLKNQDPLSPQDGTEFVAQLTQMNSLDQLVSIRESIDKLNTYMQGQPATGV